MNKNEVLTSLDWASGSISLQVKKKKKEKIDLLLVQCPLMENKICSPLSERKGKMDKQMDNYTRDSTDVNFELFFMLHLLYANMYVIISLYSEIICNNLYYLKLVKFSM